MVFAKAPQTQLITNGGAVANGADFDWPGGAGLMSAEATAWAGTCKLQYKTPNSTYIDVGTDVTFTANGIGGFNLPECTIRAVHTTAAPTALNVYVSRIR